MMTGERGSVTILLSLLAAVMLTIGLGFNWLVKEHLRTSDGLKEKAAAIVKARSAYDTLIYLLLTGRIGVDAVYFDEGAITSLKSIPLNGTAVMIEDGVYVEVQDSNGQLSLATINPSALERLLRSSSDASTAAIVTASLLDWTDEDDMPRLNGAEAASYAGQGLPYRPRNYPLQYPGEVQFVRGMNADLYRRVSSSLTSLPATGFNPNTAGDAALKAFLNINDSGVASIRNYLKQKNIMSKDDLFRLTGKSYEIKSGEQWFVPSYDVDVVVRVGVPRSLYRIEAGLSAGQALFYPCFIHYWKEE